MGSNLDLPGATQRERLHELLRLKIVRYALASVVAVIVGQGALWFLKLGLDWHGVPANLVSVTLGSIPNYTINRYWTWQQRGRNRLWGEIVPFWVMALLGTILSTVFIAFAERQWGTALAVSIAQLSGFGVLWFARFLILDKVMWRVMHDLHPEIEIDPAEAGFVGALATNPHELHGTNGGDAVRRPTPQAPPRG